MVHSRPLLLKGSELMARSTPRGPCAPVGPTLRGTRLIPRRRVGRDKGKEQGHQPEKRDWRKFFLGRQLPEESPALPERNGRGELCLALNGNGEGREKS